MHVLHAREAEAEATEAFTVSNQAMSVNVPSCVKPSDREFRGLVVIQFAGAERLYSWASQQGDAVYVNTA